MVLEASLVPTIAASSKFLRTYVPRISRISLLELYDPGLSKICNPTRPSTGPSHAAPWPPLMREHLLCRVRAPTVVPRAAQHVHLHLAYVNVCAWRQCTSTGQMPAALRDLDTLGSYVVDACHAGTS